MAVPFHLNMKFLARSLLETAMMSMSWNQRLIKKTCIKYVSKVFQSCQSCCRRRYGFETGARVVVFAGPTATAHLYE